MNDSPEMAAHGGGAQPAAQAMSDGDFTSASTTRSEITSASSGWGEVAPGQEIRLQNTSDFESQALNDIQSAVSALVGQWRSAFPDYARKYVTIFRKLSGRHWQLRFAVPDKDILTICMLGWMREKYRRVVKDIGLKSDAWSTVGAELQLDVYGHLDLPPLNGPLTIDTAVPHLSRWYQVRGRQHRAAAAAPAHVHPATTKQVSTSTFQTSRWLKVIGIAGS